MKKRSKKRKLQSLPLDLSSLQGKPVELLQAKLQEAITTAQESFDAATGALFVFSGKDTAPLGSTTKATPDGVTLRLFTSSKRVSISALEVFPSLSSDTTGNRRAAVKVSAVRGEWISIPNGFIWNNGIFMRAGAKIENAKGFIARAGGDPSPAYALGKSAQIVTDAATSVLLEAINETGKDSE